MQPVGKEDPDKTDSCDVLKQCYSVFSLREGCGKSKWKFKMVFALKGGGLEGVSIATYLF